MLITAKFAGTCQGCNSAIAAGEHIEWSRGTVFHTACLPRSNRSPCEVCGAQLQDHVQGGRKNRQRLSLFWGTTLHGDKIKAAGLDFSRISGKLACWECREPFYKALNS